MWFRVLGLGGGTASKTDRRAFTLHRRAQPEEIIIFFSAEGAVDSPLGLLGKGRSHFYFLSAIPPPRKTRSPV